MQPDLDQYFERIGFDGEAKADIATLRALHRAHALAIPYENLDVYLERPVDQDVTRIFRKLVHEGRGGWCYEMNGLLGWALREIGFAVTRHTGGVFRAEHGDVAFGNHLVHTVALEESENQTWIVDVGIGDFVKEPIVLREGEVSEGARTFRLEHMSDGSWRVHNTEGAMPPSFDFFFDAADEDLLHSTCENLQSDPQSMFRQNLICQQMTPTGFKGLLGRTWTDTDKGVEGHLIASEDELVSILTEDLGIMPPPLGDLWGKVAARHEALFNEAE